MAQAVHVPILLARRDLFEVAALCDLSPGTLEAVGEHCGVAPKRRYVAVADLLAAGGVDALIVLTSGSHGATCAAAAEARLPVFCEKPLAYTLAETDALTAADPRLAVGYMKLYDPAFQRARALMAERPPPRSVEVTVLHPPPQAQLRHVRLVRPDDLSERTRAALDADTETLLGQALGQAPPLLKQLYAWNLLGTVVHDLALVREIVGDPIRCDHVDVWPDDSLPQSLSILCLLPGDVRLSIRVHYLDGYPAYREELRVHDELGTLELVFPSPYLLHAPTDLTASTERTATRGRRASARRSRRSRKSCSPSTGWSYTVSRPRQVSPRDARTSSRASGSCASLRSCAVFRSAARQRQALSRLNTIEPRMSEAPNTTLIEHLEFALTVDSQDRVLHDAAIVVQGERIVAIGETGEVLGRYAHDSFDTVVDGRRLGVVPGFVDTHVHLSETLSRAVFPDNLGTRAWVFHWAKPFYAHVGPEDERVSVLLGTTEMLRCGTTCFLDMGAQKTRASPSAPPARSASAASPAGTPPT